jgi:hypothetical protein
MANTTKRDEIRTRVRDYLYESSADWFTDAQLNRLLAEEIRSLPAKDIYLEQVHETNLVANQMDYTLPATTVEVEKIERNAGTASDPDWTDLTGWDIYNGAIYLDWKPSTNDEIRAFLRCSFTVPTDDIEELDVPDEICEIVVWGTVIRCYKMVIGYLRQAKNWDSVSKPDLLTISTVQGWIQEAKRDYLDLIKQYSTTPRPRDINLVS